MDDMSSPPRQRRRLPRWRAALQRYRDQLAPATYDRYAAGLFPPPLAVVMNDPDALEDLVKDLREEQRLAALSAAA